MPDNFEAKFISYTEIVGLPTKEGMVFMSDSTFEEGHTPRHKFHQHDADLSDDSTDEVEYEDPDEAWANAMTPVEYVLSSEEAMASALEQSQFLAGE